MDEDYEVTEGANLSKFYKKNFQKKYKALWSVTFDSLEQLCKRIDSVYVLEQCDEIKSDGPKKLLKIDFAIAKTGQSPKTSGCRLIAVSNDDLLQVEMLIVYHKSDIEHINKNETLAWKSLVSDLYPEHRNLVS